MNATRPLTDAPGGQLPGYRVDVVSDDPDTQVAQTIGLMTGYVRADASSPEIQRDLQSLKTQNGLTPGAQGLVERIYAHVKGRMRFVRDEVLTAPIQPLYSLPIVECLTRPRDVSRAGSAEGDCDDFTMYGAALLVGAGIPVSFVTVAADPEQPGTYSHVYLAAYPDGCRVPLDMSHGPNAGWETPHYSRRTEWPVTAIPNWAKAVLLGLTALALCMRRN